MKLQAIRSLAQKVNEKVEGKLRKSHVDRNPDAGFHEDGEDHKSPASSSFETLNGTKRGICVPWNFEADDWALYQDAIDSGKLSWVYIWEMWKPKGLPDKINFIPMCRTADGVNDIEYHLQTHKSDKQVHRFLGFNEPDIDNQANISAKDASKLWKNKLLPLLPDFKQAKGGNFQIVSPAVSNGPNGLPFLEEFFDQLAGVEEARVDCIGIHYYGSNVEHFKMYVKNVFDKFQKPIRVTEFACTNWDTSNPVSEEDIL